MIKVLVCVVSLVLRMRAPLGAQSGHLIALEGSTPTVELTAGLPLGLVTVVQDPTLAPNATGGFVSVFQADYSSARIVHGGVAFRWGPRWSMWYGYTEINGLFDSTLINQDPTLSSLRARAMLAGVDVALSTRWLVPSVGWAFAADDNVGTEQVSSIVRFGLRLVPLKSGLLSFGFGFKTSVGGSLSASKGGQNHIDAVIRRNFSNLQLLLAAAFSSGTVWRYSETKRGYALSTRVLILSSLALDGGIGRYNVSFGDRSHESFRSVSASLILGKASFAVRYTNTALAMGTGYGVTLAYESNGVRKSPHEGNSN